MIRKNIKQNKGITLISMILAIIVIFIIIGTISYSSINSFKVRNLQNLFSDIDTLDDAISVYYIKNGDLPVYYSSYDFNGNKCEYQPFSIKNTMSSSITYLKFKEKNRNNSFISYGILDATKLNNVNLNKVHNVPSNIEAGNFFQNKSNDKKNLESSISSGIYVINLDTHKVYYTKGVASDGKMYYTKDDDNSSTIYSFNKQEESTVEQNELHREKEEEITDPYVTVKFWANGGVGVPDIMKVYFPETESITQKKLSSLLSGYAPPGRTGMKFLGYSTFSGGNDVQILYFNSGVSSGYVPNGDKDIIIKKTDCGNEINVYAIWGDANSSVMYYYKLEEGGTSGGINPTLSAGDKSISRSSTIPEGVSNYLYFDIPSSGYTISWEWDNNNNETKQAIYDGDSKKNNIITGNKYTTTESGTIKIKGSFSNLQITGDGNSKTKFYPNYSAKILKIYGTSGRKDKAGTILKDAKNKDLEWMTDIDRIFTIPINMLSYKNMGIKDKNNKDLYATDPDSKEEFYYLKKVIVTDTDSAKKEGNKIDDAIGYDGQYIHENYVYGAYDFGENVQLPASSEKTYCFYAYFGAKNYKITSSNSANSNQKYYYEDLKEAFDSAIEKKFDNIEIMDNVNTKTAIDSVKNTPNSDKYYIENYDPSYDKDINLKNSGSTINLNFKSYNLRRKGSVIFSNIILKGSNNSASLEFVDSDSNIHNNENSDWKFGNSNIDIQGNLIIKNLSIKSNTQNNNIIRLTGSGLNGSSSLKILDGTTIINTNYVDNKENPAIISMDSNAQQLYLGCESKDQLNVNNRTKDSKIRITNGNGYCVDFRNRENQQESGGYIIWNYGILSTYNYKYKAGYIGISDNLEKISTADKNQAYPCILNSGEKYNDKDIINIQLAEKMWTWSDSDSGSTRSYASNTLQNAHNMMNLSEKSTSMTLTRNSAFKKLENNVTTITKDVNLDFNSTSSSMITVTNSNLIIKAKVNIKKYYGNTNSKISVTGENGQLEVLQSTINGNGSDYTIENISGANVNIGNGSSGVTIKGKGKGIYSSSKLEIDNGSVNATSGIALTLAGETCKICNNSNISGTQGIKSSNTNLEINNGKVKSTSGIALTLEGGTCNISNNSNISGTQCIKSSNATLEINNGKVNVTSGIALTLEGGNCNISNNSNISGPQGIKHSNATLEINNGKVKSTSGIALTLSGGTCKIYNSSNISGTQGIKNSSTNLTITANASTNKSSNSSGPTIESTGSNTTDYAISVESGTLTLGKNESSPDVNTSIPTIKSKNIGVKLGSSGNFNFYDGSIYSNSAISIQTNNTTNPTEGTSKLKLPSNYKIKYEGKYKEVEEKNKEDEGNIVEDEGNNVEEETEKILIESTAILEKKN